MTNWVDCISSIANLVMSLAAVAAAIAAFRGLNTWKNQSMWQADTELAKRALLSTYEFRDSLYQVRHPAMSWSEMEVTPEELERISAGSKDSAGVINAYVNRWKKHGEKRRTLDAVLLEADVVWGKDLRDRLDPLFELEHELYVYISTHLNAHHRGDTELAKSYREILKGERDILYDMLDAEKDEFRADFETHLKEVEDFRRTKLGRNQ